MNAFDSGFPIETLALPHESPTEHRRLLDEWYAAYTPASPIDRALIEQAVVSLIEARRLLQIRMSVRTETVRTAELYWEHAQEDDVEKYKSLFNVCPYSATIGLNRSAAGLRFMIERWVRLETLLAADGTWFGSDRMEAIQLQGLSAMVEDLYFSEDAWMTWLDCLAAQPHPKQPDIDLICRPTVVPKALQDKDFPLWPQDPEASRARLHALVARELPPLRAREQALRVQYEEPARAAARDLALARAVKDEAPLLRALRNQERSFHQASSALEKRRNQAARSGAVRETSAALLSAPRVGAQNEPTNLTIGPTLPEGAVAGLLLDSRSTSEDRYRAQNEPTNLTIGPALPSDPVAGFLDESRSSKS